MGVMIEELELHTGLVGSNTHPIWSCSGIVHMYVHMYSWMHTPMHTQTQRYTHTHSA
jgi:hypothetical protein